VANHSPPSGPTTPHDTPPGRMSHPGLAEGCLSRRLPCESPDAQSAMNSKKRQHSSEAEDQEDTQGSGLCEGWHGETNSESKAECHVSIRQRQVDTAVLNQKQLARIASNRQAAQTSRNRQKAYVSELEFSNVQLQAEASDLRTRVRVLEHEKGELFSEVSHLKSEFDQLRALLLARISMSTPSPEHLVNEQVKTTSNPTSTSPTAAFSSQRLSTGTRMTLHPTALSATIPVLHATPSPSIKLVDQHHLGRCRATNPLPLSGRNHCMPELMRWASIQQQRLQMQRHRMKNTDTQMGCDLAPLTRRLLNLPLAKRIIGSTMGQATESIWKTFSGQRVARSRNIQMRKVRQTALSSTWSTPAAPTPSRRRLSLADLMNQLITKYQPK